MVYKIISKCVSMKGSQSKMIIINNNFKVQQKEDGEGKAKGKQEEHAMKAA